ncbi:MAG: serine hydrolase [Verrucomicrobiales bacterium]|nr:serine hydrolase [Verrucomicrobiales bacterium]
MRGIVVFCWLGFAVSASGVEWEVRVEGLMEELMDVQRVPGVSLAVVEDGKLAWERGFGVADLENSVPATEKTVYRFGAISKALTGVAAMKLVEEGKLDLDRPVGEIVRSWPKKHSPLTVRQLLGHTSGVRHYLPLEIYRTMHFQNLESALSIFKDDVLLSLPGENYRYSTYGFTLAGRVMEVVSGEPFMKVLGRTVLEPSGTVSLRQDEVAAIIPHRAPGYVWAGRSYLNSTLSDTSYKTPGEGLCGTAGDLGKFAVALMGGKLISAESKQKMWTAQTLADGRGTQYGLGWRVAEYQGRLEVSHGGGQQRVSTFLAMLPGEKVAVALLCNLEKVRLEGLAWVIVRTVLGEE